jgi:hypothetical protein
MKSEISVLVSWVDGHQTKAESNHEELMATMKDCQERMEALMDVNLDTMEVCLEETETNEGKVKTKMEACLENMEMETIGAPENRSGGPATGYVRP